MVLQEFRPMVVYSSSNYLLRFRFYLMMYNYCLIYFPDLHHVSQIKNSMPCQHYKIISLLGVFPFTLIYFILYPSILYSIHLSKKVNSETWFLLRSFQESYFLVCKIWNLFCRAGKRLPSNSKMFNYWFSFTVTLQNFANF